MAINIETDMHAVCAPIQRDEITHADTYTHRCARCAHITVLRVSSTSRSCNTINRMHMHIHTYTFTNAYAVCTILISTQVRQHVTLVQPHAHTLIHTHQCVCFRTILFSGAPTSHACLPGSHSSRLCRGHHSRRPACYHAHFCGGRVRCLKLCRGASRDCHVAWGDTWSGSLMAMGFQASASRMVCVNRFSGVPVRLWDFRRVNEHEGGG